MKKAFTLIELVIVIAIVAIMAVVAVPAFNRYGAKTELQNKSDEIVLMIEKARRLAVSPNPYQNSSRLHIFSSPPRIVLESGRYDSRDASSPFQLHNTETMLIDDSGRGDFSVTNLIAGASSTSEAVLRLYSPAQSGDIVIEQYAGERIEFNLVRKLSGSAEMKKFIISNEPFKVEVQ